MFLWRLPAAALLLGLIGLAPLAGMVRPQGASCCCADICILSAKRMPCHGADSAGPWWQRTCSGRGDVAETGLLSPGILPAPVRLAGLDTGPPPVTWSPALPPLQAYRPPTPPPKHLLAVSPV